VVEMVFMIIALIVIAYAIYWLWQNQKLTLPTQQETPMDIAKKRYAKGEITKKQFEDTRKELGG
jgi:uncharacterized membrane protein